MANGDIPVLWTLRNDEIMEELTRIEWHHGIINVETGEGKSFGGGSCSNTDREIALMCSALRRIMENVIPRENYDKNGTEEIPEEYRKFYDEDEE